MAWDQLHGEASEQTSPHFGGAKTSTMEVAEPQCSGGRLSQPRSVSTGASQQPPTPTRAADSRRRVEDGSQRPAQPLILASRIPVSLYEQHRNAAIAAIQGNRNPLIDLAPRAREIDFALGCGG